MLGKTGRAIGLRRKGRLWLPGVATGSLTKEAKMEQVRVSPQMEGCRAGAARQARTRWSEQTLASACPLLPTVPVNFSTAVESGF